MLTIRFNRVGKKNRAQFRIVLQERSAAPGGRKVAVLGFWDPHLKKGSFEGEKIKEWIKRGAHVSDTVWNLLVKQKVIEGAKRALVLKSSKKTEDKSQADLSGQNEAVPTPIENQK